MRGLSIQIRVKSTKGDEDIASLVLADKKVKLVKIVSRNSSNNMTPSKPPSDYKDLVSTTVS